MSNPEMTHIDVNLKYLKSDVFDTWFATSVQHPNVTGEDSTPDGAITDLVSILAVEFNAEGQFWNINVDMDEETSRHMEEYWKKHPESSPKPRDFYQ